MDESTLVTSVMAQMRVDLEASQREAGKLENQLTCLIQLVRKAWMGDSAAASDVAKIVGVAPPEYSLHRQHDMIAVTAKPRSRVLHNWVSLTVGLLNLEYKKTQHSAFQTQHSYLAERNEFLNEQLAWHDEMLNSQQGRPVTSSRSFIDQEIEKKLSSGSRPPTGKKRVQHLYRSPQPEYRDERVVHRPDSSLRRPESSNLHKQRAESSLTWGDLFVKGYHKNEDGQQANQTRSQPRIQFSDGEATYEDPQRYSKLDLFELALTNEGQKRPLKRVNSVDRARPKSSVQRASSAPRGRPPNQNPSGPQPQRPRTAHVSRVFAQDFTVVPVREPSPELAIRKGPPPPPTVPHLGRALSEQYRQDIEREMYHEREFRKTASQLQKKLGITLDGMV